jgi:hypothetical protein
MNATTALCTFEVDWHNSEKARLALALLDKGHEDAAPQREGDSAAPEDQPAVRE